MIVDGARSGKPVGKLGEILQLGLPEGKVAPEGLKLSKANAAQLKEHLKLTDAEVRRFESYRASARRVHHYVRELKAVQEARRLGAEAASESWRSFARGSTADRVKVIADFLGYNAEPVETAKGNKRAEAEQLRTAERAGQLLASFRDANGKIDWKRLSKSEAFSGASGIGHFAFSLFLKELVVAAHSGDEERLGEFLESLCSVDFFLDYTLFATGARAADVIYGRYVRRMARKGVLQGLLRSQLVLAAGLAVPMLARGQFSLDTYVVDVAALGISAAGVKLAVEGAKGVFQLVRRGRPLMRAGRLTNVAGWVFTAGETAVVLLVGDTLANKFDRFLDRRRLRSKIQDGQSRLGELLKKINDGEPVTPETIEQALNELEQAYEGVRTHATAPLDARIAQFRDTLAAHSEAVLEESVEGAERTRRLAEHPNLERLVERDHGSVEDYVSEREEARLTELEAEVETESREFDAGFKDTLHQVYEGNATPENPAPTEGSRLASYDEETLALLDALDKTQNEEARLLIARAIERVRFQRALDRNLYDQGTGRGAPPAPAAGDEPTAETEIPTVSEEDEPRRGGVNGALDEHRFDPSWQPEDERRN
ncbi:MAG: hypothetical protein R3F62_07205 [Planctomycetota bacterium]